MSTISGPGKSAKGGGATHVAGGSAGKAWSVTRESQAGKRSGGGMGNKSSGSKAGGKRGVLKADIVESQAGKRSAGGRGNKQQGGGKARGK